MSFKYRNKISSWHNITKLVAFGGLISFVLSLLLIAIFTSGEDIQGSWLLLTGWLGFIFFQYAWFANPLILLALLLLSTSPKISIFLSFIAIIFATQSFYFTEIPIGINQEIIFIKELGLGFYFWYFSIFLFFCASGVEAFLDDVKAEPLMPNF